jgi:hypothetical protein
VQAALFLALAICFLILSFQSSENEVLQLLGETPDQLANSHIEKQVQYTFIAISFGVIITASLGLSAAYS